MQYGPAWHHKKGRKGRDADNGTHDTVDITHIFLKHDKPHLDGRSSAAKELDGGLTDSHSSVRDKVTNLR